MKTKKIAYFRNILLVITLVLLPMCVNAMRTSVAGFFPLQNSGRVVYNFNEGWRFKLGDVANAEAEAFDDSKWQVVCAPHSVTLVPDGASGGRNYQGVCWYRKH